MSERLERRPEGTSAALDRLPFEFGGPGVILDHFPTTLPRDLYPISILEDVFERAVNGAKAGTRPSLYCRSTTKTIEDVKAVHAVDLGFRGRLEDRLMTEGLHIMVNDMEVHDPRLLPYLDGYVRLVKATFGADYPVIHPKATLFVSSPAAVVRLHNDPEEGLLHQISGHKTIHLYPYDPARYDPGRPNGAAMEDERRAFLVEHEATHLRGSLEPGRAVYIPSLAPHWVESAPDINVSLTFTFFSPAGLAHQKIAQLRKWAKRHNVALAPYAGGTIVDRLKCLAYDFLERTNRLRIT